MVRKYFKDISNLHSNKNIASFFDSRKVLCIIICAFCEVAAQLLCMQVCVAHWLALSELYNISETITCMYRTGI